MKLLDRLFRRRPPETPRQAHARYLRNERIKNAQQAADAAGHSDRLGDYLSPL